LIAELGQFALAIAFVFAMIQSVTSLYGAHRRNARHVALGAAASVGQLAFIAAAFAFLTYAFVVTDTSIVTVAENSHTAKPLVYKLSGVWANHEGSMLLWVFILALFGAMVTVFGSEIAPSMKARVTGVQGLVSAALDRKSVV